MAGSSSASGPRAAVPSARPLVAARVFSAAITFVIPLALARLLSLDHYGTFKQFFLLSHTLYFALAMGIPQSLYYFLPRSEGADRKAYLGQTLVYLIAGGVVAGCTLFGATPILRWVGGDALLAARLPIALYCALLLGGGALEAGLTAQGRPGSAAIAYFASDTVKMISYVVPALLGKGLEGVLWGAVCYAAARTLGSWIVLALPLPGPLVRRALVPGQVRYALPYGGAMLLGMPQQQLHQYVVSVSSTPAVFAVYSVGCFNLPIVDLLYTPTTELLMYRMGELDRLGRPASESAELFREASANLAFVFLPIAAGLWVIAPQFLAFLYGPKFVDAAPIMRIALGMVALASLPLDGVLRARDRTRQLFFAYVAKLGFTVPLVLGLAHALGPLGAMLGFVSAEACHKLVLLALAARALLPERAKAGWLKGTLLAIPGALPLRHVARAAGAAFAAALLAWSAQQMIEMPPLYAVLVLGTAFWVAYALALAAVGMRPAALLERLRA